MNKKAITGRIFNLLKKGDYYKDLSTPSLHKNVA